jgi:hypothetical protein
LRLIPGGSPASAATEACFFSFGLAPARVGRFRLPGYDCGGLRLARDLLAGDRISEDDPAGGDLEFADLGLVGAPA